MSQFPRLMSIDVAALIVVAHGGHSAWWVEFIWVAPVLLFVGFIAVNALRDRRKIQESRQARKGGL